LEAAALPARASAGELRDFCPDRPGLGTPACTMDRGHLAIELGVADWTLDKAAGSRTDDVVGGDLLMRYGLNDSLEAQIGWQAMGFERERGPDGSIQHRSGIGDVRLALRQNLLNPDASGVSIAFMPFVTLPVGGSAIGEGDWTAGLLLPVSYALPNDVQLAFTGEVDDAADRRGGGHHLAYSAVVGMELPVTDQVDATLEVEASRDREQSSPTTELLGGVSVAWMARPSLQFDAGANLGLNNRAPDLELYLGVATRF
jgi:outer membrane putative beta-barrel porin/alpha-amylase